MNFLRNLSPRGKRIAVIGAAALVAVVVLMARRKPAAPAAGATDTTGADQATGAAGFGAGGTLPGYSSDLPNAGFDTGAGTADIIDAIAGLGDRIDAIPSPSSASESARYAGDVFGPGTSQDVAAPAPVTPTTPITESRTPVAPRPQPAPRPIPNALPASAGGRRVGPWATAAMRDRAVAGIPAGKVRKFSSGGKFYAEIFD